MTCKIGHRGGVLVADNLDNLYILTNEERKEILERLSIAIDNSKLNFNEFLFTSSDLIRSVLWHSILATRSEEEVKEIRERVIGLIRDVLVLLDKHTDSIAEDGVILASALLEVANEALRRERENQQTDETEAQAI